VLTVLNTETALFTARDTLVQVKYARLQALVDVYRALGAAGKIIGGSMSGSSENKSDTASGRAPDRRRRRGWYGVGVLLLLLAIGWVWVSRKPHRHRAPQVRAAR